MSGNLQIQFRTACYIQTDRIINEYRDEKLYLNYVQKMICRNTQLFSSMYECLLLDNFRKRVLQNITEQSWFIREKIANCTNYIQRTQRLQSSKSAFQAFLCKYLPYLTYSSSKVHGLCLLNLQVMHFLRGHFLTTLTRFWPFLTTYLPRVDICEGIPLLL